MMGRRFARIVEECLHRLDRGEDLPDVLADFPGEAEQLKPLLLVAMASRSITTPLPSQTALRLGRNQMLSAMDRVGAAPTSKKFPFHQRARQWSRQLVNSLRAQYLLRPAPSYRLAIIALVVVFGSGLFALSASASPGDLLNAFSTDFQGVMGLFDRDSGEDSADYFNFFSIFSEKYGLFSGKQAAKVAFQLDFSNEPDSQGIAKHWAGETPTGSAPNARNSNETGPDAEDPTNPAPVDPADPKPVPTDSPDPFPGNAANVVNEVVSDTAKEKNPVWDELPFNQTDNDDDLDDLDDPEDENDIDDQDCSDEDNGPGEDVCDPPDNEDGEDDDGEDDDGDDDDGDDDDGDDDDDDDDDDDGDKIKKDKKDKKIKKDKDKD